MPELGPGVDFKEPPSESDQADTGQMIAKDSCNNCHARCLWRCNVVVLQARPVHCRLDIACHMMGW